jgi:predicted dehydrogenase
MTNIAVIGCGYWGMNYVRLLHELPQARLVTACDLDPQRRKILNERFPLLSVAETVDEVLHNRWIDAVVIATPASTHHALVKQALQAGKHVMVEKPLTNCVEDADDLVNAARMHDRILMVGLTFLYNAGIAKMKELIGDPSFGSVYYLHLTRTNLGPVRPDVSVIWDLASHDLAICDFLLDRQPLWVQANASTVLGHTLEDVAFITLGYPDNVIANVHVSWVDPNKVREVVAVGSQRRIVFDDLNQMERVRIYEKGITSARQEADSFGEFKLLVRDGDILSPRVPPTEPLRSQMEHFLNCIATESQPVSAGTVGAANVRTLVAIERSLAMDGRRVPLSFESLLEPQAEVCLVSSNGTGRK